MLCPNCNRLIGIDEPACPHCGVARPGAWWHRVLTAGTRDPRRLVTGIIYLNAAMFAVSLLLDLRYVSLAPRPLSFLSPSIVVLERLGAAGTAAIHGLHGWWSLLAANYLHGGILHIFFNMAALWQLAPVVIREYGLSRMVIIYTLGGVCGFLLSYLVGVRLTIGASAAVCGLVGAILYFGKSRGGAYGTAIYKQVGGWVIFIFIFGLLVPGINNWGHGGGIAAGLLLGFGLGYREKKPERLLHRRLAGVCIFSTLAVLGWAVLSALVQSL